MTRLDRTIAWLVYASVVLGVLFLYVLNGIPGIPSFLFPAILVGEVVWIACAVAIFRKVKWAPYMAVVLALITLGVSLPQPTHYDFAQSGQVVAFVIFSGGSLLQFLLIGAVAVWFIRSRAA